MNIRYLIPAHSRPEMLYHCLRNIRQGTYYPGEILVRLDTGWDREIRDVLAMFMDLPITVKEAPRHAFSPMTKQSANVLGGLIELARAGEPNDIIHLVEDDVMLAHDHIQFSLHAHQAREAFAVITSWNCNGGVTLDTDPALGVYYTRGDYRGIGASFRARVILEHITPRVTQDYLRNPKGYIRATFVPDPFGGAWCEQDGLIRRIQMQHGMPPIAYALSPRSYHAGFYGKNRGGKRPTGTLTQRIDKLGAIIYDVEAMRKANRIGAYFEDSRPIPLTP